MAYDLRREPWIPWRRRSGAVEWAPPAALVSRLTGDDADPVVALAAPRPDFDGALQELLIGLVTAALQPPDDDEWERLWRDPPSPEALQAAFDALPDAFDLDGDGPRFFQDIGADDLAQAEPGPVEQLLMDTPGDQGVRLNKDLFVKRDRAGQLSRATAAMALVTLQTYAPAGGAGHRTSLRGGGPLTTLVDPRIDVAGQSHAHERPLWYAVWANVETQEQLANRSPSDAPSSLTLAFPWLAPTRTSNPKARGCGTTPADAHPLQAYFGLPRRIRLEFGGVGRCDLTGREDERTVTGFRMLNYGVQYTHWHHPLSPHYRTKPTEDWLPVHGQPSGLGWREWMSLALEAPPSAARMPAQAVAAFHGRGARVGVRRARLHAFGYDMDNMKARGWVDATLPVFVVGDAARQALLYATAFALTDATGIAASLLLGAVRSTLFQNPDEAPGDLGHVRGELWGATEAVFYDAMAALAGADVDEYQVETEVIARKQRFAAVLLDRALEVFDRWCPAAGLPTASVRRRVTARYDLAMALRGYSKLGEKMFTALGIPHPGGGRAARAAKKRSRQEGAG